MYASRQGHSSLLVLHGLKCISVRTPAVCRTFRRCVGCLAFDRPPPTQRPRTFVIKLTEDNIQMENLIRSQSSSAGRGARHLHDSSQLSHDHSRKATPNNQTYRAYTVILRVIYINAMSLRPVSLFVVFGWSSAMSGRFSQDRLRAEEVADTVGDWRVLTLFSIRVTLILNCVRERGRHFATIQA